MEVDIVTPKLYLSWVYLEYKSLNLWKFLKIRNNLKNILWYFFLLNLYLFNFLLCRRNIYFTFTLFVFLFIRYLIIRNIFFKLIHITFFYHLLSHLSFFYFFYHLLFGILGVFFIHIIAYFILRLVRYYLLVHYFINMSICILLDLEIWFLRRLNILTMSFIDFWRWSFFWIANGFFFWDFFYKISTGISFKPKESLKALRFYFFASYPQRLHPLV